MSGPPLDAQIFERRWLSLLEAIAALADAVERQNADLIEQRLGTLRSCIECLVEVSAPPSALRVFRRIEEQERSRRAPVAMSQADPIARLFAEEVDAAQRAAQRHFEKIGGTSGLPMFFPTVVVGVK